jgi:hypothetical protein
MTLPTFVYPADAAALKTAGTPVTPTAQAPFNSLVNDAKNMIQSDLGARKGLESMLTEALVSSAQQAFGSLDHDGELPDGMRAEIERRASLMAESIAETVGFAVVATIVNFLGTSGASGLPLLTFSAGAATPASPISPVQIGIAPNGAPTFLAPY